MAGAFTPRSIASEWRRTVAAHAPALVDTATESYRQALVALLLVGFILRLFLLNGFPFREDEALYSYWALHLWQIDPLALQVWPDKPPLFLWLLGAAFHVFGPSEATARLVNIAASTATIPIIAATARHIWGGAAGLAAALVFALNPFAISFAPTAYTDPMLVLWGMLALHAAVTGRSFWTGLWLGAAIVTKQQGLLFVPLVVGGWWLAVGGGRQGGRRAGGQGGEAKRRAPTTYLALRAVLGFTLVILPVLGWDSLRWHVAPSPWDLSVRNYGGFALAPIAEWGDRLWAWAALLWYVTASWPVWFLLAVLAPIVAIGRRGGKAQGGAREEGRRGAAGVSRYHAICHLPSAVFLLLWSLAFFGFHVITTTQIWDRYLLPLAPMICLLVGWSVGRVPGNRSRISAALVLGVLLLPPAVAAVQGKLPIGGDHGDYAGLTETVAWLENHAPAESVLYHRALGWHYRFTFFDANRTGQNRYDLRWYPHAVYLADNAAKIPQQRRFLVLPDWMPVLHAERDFAARALELVERYRAGKFTVFEVIGPPQDPCNWCVCQGDALQKGLPSWLH